MSEIASAAWLVTEVDAVGRLHALAAGVPGAVVVERVIAVPFETVWAVASDLERSVPDSEWHVRSLRITRVDEDRVEAEVTGWGGMRDRFVGVLRPG